MSLNNCDFYIFSHIWNFIFAILNSVLFCRIFFFFICLAAIGSKVKIASNLCHFITCDIIIWGCHFSHGFYLLSVKSLLLVEVLPVVVFISYQSHQCCLLKSFLSFFFYLLSVTSLLFVEFMFFFNLLQSHHSYLLESFQSWFLSLISQSFLFVEVILVMVFISYPSHHCC